MERHVENLRKFSEISSKRFRSFKDLCNAYIELGREVLDLDTGIASKINIETEKYTILSVKSSLEGLHRGQEFNLGDTYCAEVYKEMKAIAFEEVGKDPKMCTHPVYLNAKLESYIATPVIVNDEPYGTLNFSDLNIRTQGFTDYDMELISLMGKALGSAIEYYEKITENEIIFENISDALIFADKDRVIQRVNSAFSEIFGYSKDESKGMPTFNLYESLEEHSRQGKVRFNPEAKQSLKPFINIYKRKDGSVFPGETIARIITREDGEIFMVGTVRDISERKEIERLKDEFIATMNHELRTPLTSISGSIKLLKDLVKEKLDPDEYNLIEVSDRNSNTLLNLINDLLDFDKFNYESFKIQKTSHSLKKILERNIQGLSGFLELYGNKIDLEEIPEEVEILADEKRIDQILFNLLSNAVKFSPKGSEVKIRYNKKEDGVQISIIDNGPGIPEDKLDYIFDAFTQVDSTDSRGQGGTGLGLAICKKIIDLHKGSISVANNQGPGCTFSFFIPEK